MVYRAAAAVVERGTASVTRADKNWQGFAGPDDWRRVSGRAGKGEDRKLLLHPSGIRMTETPRGLVFTFELARGAYALLVVQRLLAGIRPERAHDDRGNPRVEGRRHPVRQRPANPSSRRPRS